ncbi:MAG TPA: 3-phosphoglycerate dehydrogenase family protein [Anaeromyxobacteraceae bacterium]|nr:3-phosphoglycerate dehydrogenase family protein [Anaeromyxobacteraceae bacterium]
MKILVADKFPEARLADLKALGAAVEYQPDVAVKDLAAAASNAVVLVVRSKKVQADVFENAPALSLVVRAGAGVNTIDVAAASRRGVFVANCPGQNAIAVAELAIGLLLALDRRVPDNVQALREGRWDKKTFSEADGLFGRAIGVAGLGAIGLETARRAAGLGMRVHAWSRSLDDEKARALGVERAPDLETLASRVDALSLHLPLKPETRGVVSRAVLEKLRPGAILVNTARAEIVDQQALLELAQAGRIRVGADVHAGEPEGGRGEFHSELATLPNFYGTHHIGASTEQAQDAIARETVRIVETFMRGGAVPNCVNVARKTPARAKLVVRHHDKRGVLANVFDSIRRAGINVQTIENTVFEQATAACCNIELDERPSPALLEEIRSRRDEVIFVDSFDL